MFSDGITINGKHSYIDYDLTINSRSIGLPSKNLIKKTIPFMNGAYDFTMLNGAATWGERPISYTFDIVGDTIEEMDRLRTEIVNVYCNMHDVDIYDDTIPDYHFHGSFSSASQNEDGEKTELTIEFLCYPFMIKNVAIEHTILYSSNLINKGQAVKPYVKSAQDCTVKIGNITQSISAGYTDLAMTMPTGQSLITLTKANQLKTPFVEGTHTENGITFTYNSNGTVTANGTATDNAWFYIRSAAEAFRPPVGKHRLLGCPTDGGSNFRIQVYAYNGTAGNSKYYYDSGAGGTVDVTEETEYLSIAIRIASGYTANNLTFTPRLIGETVFGWYEEVL